MDIDFVDGRQIGLDRWAKDTGKLSGEYSIVKGHLPFSNRGCIGRRGQSLSFLV